MGLLLSRADVQDLDPSNALLELCQDMCSMLASVQSFRLCLLHTD